MGSSTATTAAATGSSSSGRRGSSTRRGSKGSSGSGDGLQQQVNHSSGGNSHPYALAGGARALDASASGGCPLLTWQWWMDVWVWMRAQVEHRCPPGWATWVLGGLLTVTVALVALFWSLVDLVWLYAQLCSLAVPLIAIMSGYLLLTLGFRHSWTPTAIYLTFCGSIIGETLGLFLSSSFASSPPAQLRQVNGIQQLSVA